ncbi:MAG: BREX-1 system phosphatase PglZ type A, partial [Lachnospiraceae bacterium]|nr:BREX-1 system phosphatase PglZ type A [Lachnospiraceae bacterium]
LNGEVRKLVFWYDEDAEYIDEIDGIQLDGNSKLWKVSENNWFETKLQIEERDTETNYLLYAPFPRPDDRVNHLADMFYYSEHFYSDKLVQLMGDMNIPNEFQDEIKKYKRFWSSGNVKKFMSYGITDYSVENIDLGIMCVLAGIKVLSIEELAKAVLLEGFEDNSIISKMEHYKIDSVFWNKLEKSYGYKDTSPNIKSFFASVVITYLDTIALGNIPKVWKQFLSAKANDCVVFVKNLMNNDETKAFYDEAAELLAFEIKVSKLIKDIPLDNVVASDAFKDFDDNLIDWIISKIEDGMLDEKIAGMSIPDICESRMKNCYHYAAQYEEWYQMLYHGYLVIKNVELLEYKPTIKEVVADYTNSTYLIDTHYRKFYYYLDRIGMSENIETIRELVENIYTNKYLNDFSYKWNQSLTDDAYNTYSGDRESEFFESYVRPFMKEDGRFGRVIVIISDGMRYECARELYDKLELDPKCDASMSHMLSVLPSETTLGMASLLPNREIEVSEELDIHVDGAHCGNELKERQKILQSHVSRSACYKFDDVKQAKPSEIKGMFQEKDVVYIYQDQIDARGEKQPTENEVFNACQEAIDEIQKLIKNLTGYVSNTRFLVTADHGFIYKRDKLVESDKIKTDKSDVYIVSKRYLITSQEVRDIALISRRISYLSNLNKIFVSTPVGADIIKSRGGGQNYVHGGSSLQEMIVPVIKVRTAKGYQATKNVNV